MYCRGTLLTLILLLPSDPEVGVLIDIIENNNTDYTNIIKYYEWSDHDFSNTWSHPHFNIWNKRREVFRKSVLSKQILFQLIFMQSKEWNSLGLHL